MGILFFLKNWYFSSFSKLKRPVSFSNFSFFPIQKKKHFQTIYRTTTPHFIQFNYTIFSKKQEAHTEIYSNGGLNLIGNPCYMFFSNFGKVSSLYTKCHFVKLASGCNSFNRMEGVVNAHFPKMKRLMQKIPIQVCQALQGYNLGRRLGTEFEKIQFFVVIFFIKF